MARRWFWYSKMCQASKLQIPAKKIIGRRGGGGLKKGLSLNQNDYDSIEGVMVDLELDWQELRKSRSNSNY